MNQTKEIKKVVVKGKKKEAPQLLMPCNGRLYG
jgi:hypothetical protein